MVRNNNMIPNGHFHKKWQQNVKTWFGQPMKKERRRIARERKQLKMVPGPVKLLRPMVHCPSARYNSRLRQGKGFTLLELKKANINKRYAKTIGITVDFRRRNRCYESLSRNVQRLKEYCSKLIINPEKRSATVWSTGRNLNKIKASEVKVPARVPREEEKNFDAYVTLRKARSQEKHFSRRLRRRAQKKLQEIEGIK